MLRKTTWVKDILWFLAFFGLVGGAFRMWYGLGATTNLTDSVPWGLWKILNMVAGVALSTSGFTVGFLVVVLKIEKFRPLLKPAILIAFLGYGASCFALMFDIGLPHRFWHPLLMWNEHSFLFEVFWCVMLYFTVTFIELTPNILERFGHEKLIRWLHRVSFGVVVVGISLSSLHHSSLGSIFLVTPQRLHPLWYSSWLPIFFIISAMGAGLMVVVLARILYARWYDPEPVFGSVSCPVVPGEEAPPPARGGKDMPMLKGMAAIGASVLAVYLILKVIDLVRTGSSHHLLSGTWESYLYIFEMLLTSVIPVTLLLIPRTRNTPFGLGLASFCAAAGLALNRLDVGILGYFRDAHTTYFPSLAEWAVSIGVVAAAGIVFLFVVENFGIFDKGWEARRINLGTFKASSGTLLRMWNAVFVDGIHRITLLAVFTLPVAWVLMYPPFSEAGIKINEIQPSVGKDAMRTLLRIDGDRANLFTDFPHGAHQERLGGEASCATCHHVSLPSDRSTPCSRCHRDMVHETRIFDHFLHMKRVAKTEKLAGWIPANHSCNLCHAPDEPRTAGNTGSCLACHESDMMPVKAMGTDLKTASSFQSAMHSLCISCHRQHEENKPGLADCSACHPSLRKD